MKILILTPFWKRPEIVAEYFKSLDELWTYADIELLAIVSSEDPHIGEIVNTFSFYTRLIEAENSPFGRKKNAGTTFAKALEWDYLMELNSDSIVNPAIFDLYRPYMERGELFFGLKDLYVTDYATRESLFIKDYNSGMTYGAGRMMHHSIVEDKMWTDELQCGMDDNCRGKLEKRGIKDCPVHSDVPMLVDLKTNTTLNHFLQLKNLGVGRNEPKAVNVEYEYLTEHIGYDFIST